jgi:hypothetical protein
VGGVVPLALQAAHHAVPAHGALPLPAHLSSKLHCHQHQRRHTVCVGLPLKVDEGGKGFTYICVDCDRRLG